MAGRQRGDGAMKTMPWTRSGCSAARTSERCEPSESVTDERLLGPGRVQHRERVPGVLDLGYASLVCGRSDFPFPRGSNTITRRWRAKCGICIFQQREWTIDQGGTNRIVGSPSPYTS